MNFLRRIRSSDDTDSGKQAADTQVADTQVAAEAAPPAAAGGSTDKERNDRILMWSIAIAFAAGCFVGLFAAAVVIAAEENDEKKRCCAAENVRGDTWNLRIDNLRIGNDIHVEGSDNWDSDRSFRGSGRHGSGLGMTPSEMWPPNQWPVAGICRSAQAGPGWDHPRCTADIDEQPWIQRSLRSLILVPPVVMP